MFSFAFVKLFFFIYLFSSSQAITAKRLENYGADRNMVSVSGISAGGFMAVQVHVTYSSSIMGVGVVAGGPYWCAEGNLYTALTACMETGNIDTDYLAGFPTSYALALNTIDHPEYMANDKVYVFGGTKDTVVVQDVARAAVDYYRHFIPESNIHTEFSKPAGHAMVHDLYGNACGAERSPYINNCGYNAAYEMLNYFYGPGLARPTYDTEQSGELFEFDQTEFFKNGNAASESVADIGYVYVPTGCLGDISHCKVHIALHGCLQQYEEIGDEYVKYSGYNEVGELNDVIIIYPQTIKRQMAGNPNGCWDWWGYASMSYACNLAPQMKFMKQIIDRVTGF